MDMRNQRINRESVPLADDRRAPAPARTPSRDERAPADTSRPAPYLGRNSLEQHNPWRPAPHPSPPAYSSTAAPVSHQLYNYNVAMAMHTSQGPHVGGGSSIAAPDAPVLQWGHGKRPRRCRDSKAPAPELVATAEAKAAKLMPPPGARGPNPSAAASSLRTEQRAEAEKLMPPLSARRAIIIRDTSPLPPRAATLPHRRSAAEPQAAAGGEQPAEKWEPKPLRQKPLSEKEKGKAWAAIPGTISPLPPRAVTLSLHRSAEEHRTGANEQEPEPKLMPPMSALPPCAATLSLHGSAEEPLTGANEQQAAAKEGKQRQASSKPTEKEKGKGPMVEVTPHVAEEAEQQPEQQQASIKATKKKNGKSPMVEVPPHIAVMAAAAGAAAVAAIWGPEMPKIDTQLTREEIEDDWLAMTGSKLPYRVKNKRPKKVQRRIDNIFPGQFLSSIRMANYDVGDDETKPKKSKKSFKDVVSDDDSDSD